MALWIERFDPRPGSEKIEQRHGEKEASAVLAITLGHCNRPRMRSRGDVEIRHALVTQGLGGEEARVSPIRRVHIPTRNVTPNSPISALRHFRTNQKDDADGRQIAFQQIAIFRQFRRSLMSAETRKNVLPEAPSSLRKALGEEVCQFGEVGFSDLPNS